MSADNTHLPYAGNIVDYIATNIHVAFAVVPPVDLDKQGQHWWVFLATYVNQK